MRPMWPLSVMILKSQQSAMQQPPAGHAPRMAQTVTSGDRSRRARKVVDTIQKRVYRASDVAGAYSSIRSLPAVKTSRWSPDVKVTPRTCRGAEIRIRGALHRCCGTLDSVPQAPTAASCSCGYRIPSKDGQEWCGVACCAVMSPHLGVCLHRVEGGLELFPDVQVHAVHGLLPQGDDGNATAHFLDGHHRHHRLSVGILTTSRLSPTLPV